MHPGARSHAAVSFAVSPVILLFRMALKNDSFCPYVGNASNHSDPFPVYRIVRVKLRG